MNAAKPFMTKTTIDGTEAQAMASIRIFNCYECFLFETAMFIRIALMKANAFLSNLCMVQQALAVLCVKK